MRKLVLSLLAVVSLPVSAVELQFNITGVALPAGEAGTPNIPYNVTFDLNTLSGHTSSTFSDGCLTAWSFSGVQATNLFATVGGQSVLNIPSTLAAGGGGIQQTPGNCLLDSSVIGVGPFALQEIVSEHTRPLNPQDPLADLLTTLCFPGGPPDKCFWGGAGFLPGFSLDSGNSVKISVVSEPGMLALLGLGLAALGFSRRRLVH